MTHCYNGIFIWILIIHYVYLSFLNKGSCADLKYDWQSRVTPDLLDHTIKQTPFGGLWQKGWRDETWLRNKRTSDHRNKEHCSHCSCCCPIHIHPFLEKFLPLLFLPEYSCCWLMNAAQNNCILLKVSHGHYAPPMTTDREGIWSTSSL